MQQKGMLTYLKHCAIDGDKELGLNKLGVSRVLAFAICRLNAVAFLQPAPEPMILGGYILITR